MMIGLVILIAYSNTLKEFLQDDKTKVLSSGRLMCFLLVVSYIYYSGYIVLTKGIIPDLPVALSGLIAMLYGLKQVGPNIHIGGSNGNPEK
jgi:hypothetical protein